MKPFQKKIIFTAIALIAFANADADIVVDSANTNGINMNNHQITKVSGQSFIGLIDGNKWTIYCRLSINPNTYDTDYYWEQEVIGDTIIDGSTYKKVYNRISDWNNEDTHEIDIIDNSWSFFCQEDNKIYEWIENERVLNYDFNLLAGDSFYNTADEKLIVDSVVYYNTPNNQSLKYLHLSIENPYACDEWIEGIGSMTNGINKLTIWNYGSSRKLISFISQGVEMLNDADINYVSTTSIDANAMTLHREGETVVAVFPAAGVGETITLYDTTGRIVAVVSVREDATSAIIDIAHLPQGVYIARMNSGASCKVVL